MRETLAQHFFRRRVMLWCGAVVLLFILWPGGFRLIFPAANEVSFNAGLNFTTCSGFLANDSIDSDRCRTDYRVALGNTGSNAQEHIELVLSPVPETWRLGLSVSDIVASAREKVRPRIIHHQVDDTLTFEITNLQENRQIVLQLTTLGAEAAELLAQTEAEIKAEGIVIGTNPQLTVVARFFRSMFSLFGL